MKTNEFQSARFILLDIEGTISEQFFVRKVLFPYSAERLRTYVAKHYNNPVVRDCLKQTGAIDDEGAIVQLLEWISDDIKHPALKTLQGLIWREGYEADAFRAHLYDDVLPMWRAWIAEGRELGIYSSGSKAAQDLFFHYSSKGDVREYLSAHFDLSTGSKRDPESYREIASNVGFAPSEILFLSDVVEELDAARAAGFKTGLIVRDRIVNNDRSTILGATQFITSGTASGHPVFTSLAEI